MTKTHPDLVHHLGQKSKTSPTRKFGANPAEALRISQLVGIQVVGGLPPFRRGFNNSLEIN
jgi:hypothetical protein